MSVKDKTAGCAGLSARSQVLALGWLGPHNSPRSPSQAYISEVNFSEWSKLVKKPRKRFVLLVSARKKKRCKLPGHFPEAVDYNLSSTQP